MQSINLWINFNGNAEEAFIFYQSILGGEFTKIIRFKDVAGPGFEVGEVDAEKLMQIILTIKKE
jgi:PhnB protein